MEDGQAKGVLAVNNQGEEVEVQVKAVVICTGAPVPAGRPRFFGSRPQL